jgi:flavodoxin
MKTLIIYNSIHHSNTKKVADVIGKELNAPVKQPNEVGLNSLGEYDLIGFGSGIYFSKLHVSLYDLVEELPPGQGKPVFVFTTHGAWIEIGGKKFVRLLTDKGYHVVNRFHCRGFDTWGLLKRIGGLAKGRPNEKDLKKAQEFARKLTQ